MSDIIHDGLLFRTIPDNHRYAVSQCGKVLSFCRATPKLLKPHFNRGYYNFKLVVNDRGVQKGYDLHRLVLETWVGPCPEGHQGLHLNGNPKDNRLDNLRWGTVAENRLDRVRHGTEALFEQSARQMPPEFKELWQNPEMRLEMCDAIAEAVRKVWRQYAG